MTQRLKPTWQPRTIKARILTAAKKLFKDSQSLPSHHRIHTFRRYFDEKIDSLVASVCNGSYTPSYLERMSFPEGTFVMVK